MSELDEIYFRSVYELPIYLPPPSPIFKAEQYRSVEFGLLYKK